MLLILFSLILSSDSFIFPFPHFHSNRSCSVTCHLSNGARQKEQRNRDAVPAHTRAGPGAGPRDYKRQAGAAHARHSGNQVHPHTAAKEARQAHGEADAAGVAHVGQGRADPLDRPGRGAPARAQGKAVIQPFTCQLYLFGLAQIGVGNFFMRWSLVLASLAGCFAKDTETQTIADPTARFAHSLVALPIGTDYLVKFNMTNTSILKKTVVGISATLVQDSKTVQTFPRAAVQKSVAPLGTVVLRYKLHAFANPGDYRLRVNTEFYDSDEEYSQVAIDAPVTLAYSDSLYDLQSIFMYIVLALGTAGTVWYMLKPTAEPSGSKSKRSKKQQQPRVDKQALEKASEELDMDWIPKQLVRQQEKANEPKKASKK